MGYLKVRNLLNHPEDPIRGNYEYILFDNSTEIKRGRVYDHKRDDGWELLLVNVALDAARQAEKEEVKKDG